MHTLATTGGPELPVVGTRVRFRRGPTLYQCLGNLTAVGAEHARNAAGKPGGRVVLKIDQSGEVFSVPLSAYRDGTDCPRG